MKTNGSEDIRLVRVDGENIRILKLAAVRFDGEPGLFRVTGPNEAGKTTFLDLVAMLFGGRKAVKSETIQEGQDGGFCRAELSNGYSIERRFTRAEPDGYLTVTTPDDAVPRAPQTLLDAWRGSHAFDPGALLKKKTTEVEEIILGLAKRKGLKEELAKLAAEDKALRDDRVEFNRALQRVQRMDKPEGERPEPVGVSWEMDRLNELRTIQKQREEIGLEVRELDQKAALMEGHIERLNSEIERLTSEREALAVEWKQAQATMGKAEKRLGAIEDPALRIAEVKARIQEADAVNATLEPWKEWDRAQGDVKEAKAAADKLTAKIKAVAEKRDGLLRSAEIPVSGIGFAEDGAMLLDGHSLDVASGRRRLDMAYDIAKAANPMLKVLLLDEANDYDVPSLERLDERARGDGMQVIACRIGIEGPGEIVVVDGRVTNNGADPAQLDALETVGVVT